MVLWLGGAVSAAAAATTESLLRAETEAFNHLRAFDYSWRKKITPNNLYEQRLIHFGSGNDRDVVLRRINNQVSLQCIHLPKLVHDTQLPHRFERLAVVHRCIFEGQGSFLDGDLGACVY